MIELTQKEKLLREERMLLSEIESLQYDIDLYNEDLVKVRANLADLEAGRNDNAWKSFCEAADIDQA
jgi:hypothetical protein